jgi:hypothetical protein
VPPQPRSSAGDALPQHCQVIEIRVAELRQLFNAIDPSPFRQRDLDPRAEEFIVDWASDLPADKPWALVVHLDRPAGRADEAAAPARSDSRILRSASCGVQAETSGAVSSWSHQSRHRAGISHRFNSGRRRRRRLPRREPSWRSHSRRLPDRWLGCDVASVGGVPVRRVLEEGNVNDHHLQANGPGDRGPQPDIPERMNERALLVGPRVEHIEHLKQHQRGKSHRLRVA